MSKSCEIITISDIHFGEPRLSPIEVRNHLVDLLYPQLTDDVFMLLICGDMFDTQLTMNSDAGMMAGLTISEIISICKQRGIYLRILRGTVLHDRKQNNWFILNDEVAELNGHPLIRVFNEMEIEVLPFEDTIISSLYVPADLPYADLTTTVLEMLDVQHINQVDFLVSHGYYAHHLPTGLLKPPAGLLHSKDLLPRVAGCILNGHIHTRSIYHRVVTIGSFERFTHNEESPKGFYKLNYSPTDHVCDFTFIENKETGIFHTIDLTNCKTTTESLTKLTATLNNPIIAERMQRNERIYLRLVTPNILDYQAAEAFLKEKYGRFMLKMKKLATQESANDLALLEDYDLPLITPEILPELIQKNGKLPYSVEQIRQVLNGSE